MAKTTCRRRLQKELLAIKREPVEHIDAAPHERNILEWHYVVEGPPGSVYEGGVYHGIMRFPSEYPFKPPAILMLTPNGRFKTNTRLCLSMSDFHPESWNPLWSVSSILSGLLSFMLDSSATYGSIESSQQQRRALAAKSLEHNVRNKDFCSLFPKYVELHNARCKAAEDAAKAAGAARGEGSAAPGSKSAAASADAASGEGGSNGAQSPDFDLSWTWAAAAVALLAVVVGFFAFGPPSTAPGA